MNTIPIMKDDTIIERGCGIVLPRNEGGVSCWASHEKMFCHRRALSCD